MIILNDDRFSDEIFCNVNNLSDIQNSSNNSTLIWKFNESNISLYKFCKDNNIEFGIFINSIKEFIFIINLNAKYAFVDNIELAKKLQNIADDYLTNTKVILKTEIQNIETIVKYGIDGIFVI